jgi:hypothetical protein
MALDCVALALTPFWQKDELLLVRKTDAIRLCRGGGYQEAPRNSAGIDPVSAAMRDTRRARRFAVEARLTASSLSEVDDRTLVELLRKGVARDDLVVVRRSDSPAAADLPALTKQRRLVRDIEKAVTKLLGYASHKYRLVAGADLRNLPNRESYAIVGRDEALRVLAALTEQANPSVAAYLTQARGLLAQDWRPPATPDGILLLRLLIRPAARRHEDDTPLGKPRPAMAPEPDVAPAPEPDTLSADVNQARQAEAQIDSARRGAPFCAICAQVAQKSLVEEPPPPQAATEGTDMDDVDHAAQADTLIEASQNAVPFCEECARAAQRPAAEPPGPADAPPSDIEVAADDDEGELDVEQAAQADTLIGASAQAVPFCEECARARNA